MLETQKKAQLNEGSGEEENEGSGDEDGEEAKSKSMNNTTQDKAFLEKKKLEEIQNERFFIPFEDRIMRNRDKYLINPAKHPGYQLEDICKTSNQKTEALTEMLRKKCQVHIRASVITFITILVYHRDMALKMKRERVFKQSDFAWQLSFKFYFLNVPDVIDKIQ